jgi:uncharacterized protein YkwD
VRLRSCLLSLVTALSLVGMIGMIGIVGVTSVPAQANTTREARFVARINDVRAGHGLAPLRERAGLTRYARQHSAAMSRAGQLFHTSDFNVVCCWSVVAENVGVGFSVGGVHRALMASAPHRANILDPRMRAVGVGAVKRGGRVWVTQIFKLPR